MRVDWHGKRAFITGAAGVIGRELVDRLVARGATVAGLDLQPMDGMPPGVLCLQADLADGVPPQAPDFAPDVVFHLAATFERTEETPDFWLENFRHNVVASHRLHEALGRWPSLSCVVFASSYLIYDQRLYLGRDGIVHLNEQDRIEPRNLCGIAKYQTERELEFLRHGASWRAVSARIFRVYGRGSRDVISRWVRAGVRNEPIRVFGGGGRFDYIYAGDVAEGLLRLAESSAAAGVVNLGSGRPRRIDEVVSILRSHFPQLPVREEQTAHHPLESSGADMTLFTRMTGWSPATSLEDGIATLVEYERRAADGQKAVPRGA